MKIFRSFSARLYFYIILVSVFIFGSAIYVEYLYSARHEYKQASQYTSMMLEYLIKSIHLQFMQVERTVSFYAPDVYTRIQNSEDLTDVARSIVINDTCATGGSVALIPDAVPGKGRLYMDYVYQDSLGGMVTTHYDDSSNYDYPNMTWFKGALATSGGYWTEPYFDKGGGNMLMTTYSRSLADSKGDDFAVIVADVELTDFVQRLESLRPFPESFVFILDKEGKYVAHPDETLLIKKSIFDRKMQRKDYGLEEVGEEMISGHTGSMKVHINGKDLLVCYAPMPHLGWSVACVTPYDIVVKRLGLASWTVMLIMLLGLVLMALIIRILLRYMTNPLRRLVAAANRISEGDFNFPIEVDNGSGDIAKLSRAFKDMQQNLRSYVRQLTEATKSHERERSMIEVSKNMQDRLLPQSFPIYPLRPEIDIYGLLERGNPGVTDLYDFHVSDNAISFIIATTENRNFYSSLVLVVTRGMFRAGITRGESPATMINEINKLTCESNANYREAVFVGTVDYTTGKLVYCNAGFDDPILWSVEKGGHFLNSHISAMCGERQDYEYTDEEIDLNLGDLLLVYSKGFIISEDYLGDRYGNRRMIEDIDSYLYEGDGRVGSIRRLITHLFKSMKEHSGNDAIAVDRSLLALCYRNKPGDDRIVYSSITLDNILTDIPQLSTFVEEIAGKCDWPDQLVMKISLVLEEAVSSIISYAYEDQEEGQIEITTLATPHSFSIRLIDSGKPFDPTAEIKKMEKEVSEVDNDMRGLAANKRAYGFFLIHQIMDEMEYGRIDDKNKLVMRIYF